MQVRTKVDPGSDLAFCLGALHAFDIEPKLMTAFIVD